jgi:TetR/AcrR family transcriptional repressor of nem operon
MVRTKSFDRKKALDAAIQVFWTHGYEGASAEALTNAMGIARQSLYDTFGSKRDLYLEALRTYNSRSVADLIRTMRRAQSPLASLREILLEPSRPKPPERQKGCFGINSICEFGSSDPDVGAAGQASSLALNAAIMELLCEAKAAEEVAADLDEQVACNLIACVLAGLKVAARGGADATAMRQTAELALLALTPR